MVSDAQVRLLRQKRMDGKTQAAAAASAGMSIRTAREWDAGPVPAQRRRSRAIGGPDPSVWRRSGPPKSSPYSSAITKAAPEAKWVLAELCVRYPARFHAGQARTLQRRFRDWLVVHGPEPEVYFEQAAVPGREAAIDFTHATDLGVTIAGEPLPHLLFEFVLSYSRWRWVAVAFGETCHSGTGGNARHSWRS